MEPRTAEDFTAYEPATDDERRAAAYAVMTRREDAEHAAAVEALTTFERALVNEAYCAGMAAIRESVDAAIGPAAVTVDPKVVLGATLPKRHALVNDVAPDPTLSERDQFIRGQRRVDEGAARDVVRRAHRTAADIERRS